MKKHVKVYMDYFGYGEQDVIMCENANGIPASDIHHIIFKSQGGKDEISNLVALCRECHDVAHGKVKGEVLTREQLFEIVDRRT